MREIHFADITDPLEFEERAGIFMVDVVTASKNFPDLLVETDNEHLKNLSENSKACDLSFEKKPMYRKAFARGFQTDQKTLNESLISVSISGNSRKQMKQFEKIVTNIAKENAGKINKRTGADYPDLKDLTYAFSTILLYVFRG